MAKPTKPDLKFCSIPVPPLHIKLHVICAYKADFSRCQVSLYKRLGLRAPDEFSYAFEMGALYSYDAPNKVYVVYFKRDTHIRYILHEVFHFVNSLGYLKLLDPPSETCDETYAYLYEYMVAAVHKALVSMGAKIERL